MGSYYKYSPCGQCCCSADEDHVCICSCSNPFPRRATTGDDLGTHTLTIPTLGATVWQGSHLIPGVLVCTTLGGCQCSTGTWEIVYRLTPDCPNSRWRLSVEARIAVCSGFPNRGAGTAPFWSAFAETDFSCNASNILSFEIPDVFTNQFNPGLSYPNPANGPMTVIFG